MKQKAKPKQWRCEVCNSEITTTYRADGTSTTFCPKCGHVIGEVINIDGTRLSLYFIDVAFAVFLFAVSIICVVLEVYLVWRMTGGAK